MKKNLILSLIILLSGSILILEGCKKDSNPTLELENPDLSGVMMTLSAISYIADSFPASTIKDSIVKLLGDKSLATGGKWMLDWGPGVSIGNENMIYVAKNTVGDSSSYAVVIRGTNIHSIGDIIEDFDVFKLVEFTYGMPGDSVAKGAMDGLESLRDVQDPAKNTTLVEYLNSVTSSKEIPLFITGHSLGGGLAPLVTYWLLSHAQLKDKFVFETYAFAGPGMVNKSFKVNFLNSLPANAFHMQVNSLDVIPYGYANLPGILSKNIPVHVPLLYKVFISLAQDTLDARGIVYYDIVVADTIGNIPITNQYNDINPSDTIRWFDHWLGVEHSHNNYLKLLGVNPVN